MSPEQYDSSDEGTKHGLNLLGKNTKETQSSDWVGVEAGQDGKDKKGERKKTLEEQNNLVAQEIENNKVVGQTQQELMDLRHLLGPEVLVQGNHSKNTDDGGVQFQAKQGIAGIINNAFSSKDQRAQAGREEAYGNIWDMIGDSPGWMQDLAA